MCHDIVGKIVPLQKKSIKHIIGVHCETPVHIVKLIVMNKSEEVKIQGRLGSAWRQLNTETFYKNPLLTQWPHLQKSVTTSAAYKKESKVCFGHENLKN